MANFARQYSIVSPVLAIQPQPYYQTQLSAGTFGRHHQLPMSFNTAASALATPARSAGRKRSRDEASMNLESDPQGTAATVSQEDWVYGEGMVLIKPGKGYVADASSQTGTWLEEKSDQEYQLKQQIDACQPEIRSHKSQRLDHGPNGASFHSNDNCSSSALSEPCHLGANRNDALVIDNFTVHLGIGWRKLSNEEHIQAAARGWARFIENNFDLAKVSVCLESKGLQSYLVEAVDGYYLFAENLRHGRLVSRTAEGALQNLQLSPPTFEGPELDIAAGVQQQNEVLADSAMAID